MIHRFAICASRGLSLTMRRTPANASATTATNVTIPRTVWYIEPSPNASWKRSVDGEYTSHAPSLCNPYALAHPDSSVLVVPNTIKFFRDDRIPFLFPTPISLSPFRILSPRRLTKNAEYLPPCSRNNKMHTPIRRMHLKMF